MLHCALSLVLPSSRPRVCAVSFLNTVPLVWGMLHGEQRGVFDLSFSVPSECAGRVERGVADLGILPVAEIQRLKLPYFREVGIGSRGAVRSILLISKTKPQDIRTLAADSSSRTSVTLTRIVLDRKYACRPAIHTMPPDLENMLAAADAALIIGDPALRIEPNSLPYYVLDLGQEWTDLSGLPMVFALWSGPAQFLTEANRRSFSDSCRFGLAHLDDIVTSNSASMGLPEGLVRRYLTTNLALELGSDDLRGLDLFLKYTAAMR
jgi:predicted solute-binding protein